MHEYIYEGYDRKTGEWYTKRIQEERLYVIVSEDGFWFKWRTRPFVIGRTEGVATVDGSRVIFGTIDYDELDWYTVAMMEQNVFADGGTDDWSEIFFDGNSAEDDDIIGCMMPLCEKYMEPKYYEYLKATKEFGPDGYEGYQTVWPYERVQ